MNGATAVDEPLAGILVQCSTSSRSGIIDTARGRLKRIFCIKKGHLTWVASNVIEEQFTEAMVGKGLLGHGDLAGVQAEAQRQETKLSRLLVEGNLIEEDALRTTLGRHFRELLFDTLSWPDGMSMFTPGQPDLAGEVTVELPCVPLLLEYARQHPIDLDSIRVRIGPPGTLPLRAEGPAGSLDGFEHDEMVRFLLEACDGSRQVHEITTLSPEPENPTLRAIYGLILTGALVRAAKKKKATTPTDVVTRDEVRARIQKVEGANYYAVLELGGACTTEQIRDAYYFLARRYHPDRFRSGDLADLIEPIETFFTRVTESYNTLVDPDRRAEYDEQLDQAKAATKGPADQNAKELARQNYLHARALLERGRYTDAVNSLKNAIKLDVREPTYHIEIGRLMSRNPRMRGEAEERLREAARLDPAMVDSYMALGELYEKMDRNGEAAGQFREVLRW